MFVDEVEIFVQAGKGGRGLVSFRREKYVPKGGPDGGNGGHGGNVIFEASVHLHTLLDHRYKRKYAAEDGDPGGTALKTGKSGKDVIIKVPVATLIRDPVTGEVIVDMVADGQRHVVAKGGLGGRGNAEFKSATRQAPKRADEGRPGEAYNLLLELKLIADIGLVGFPNAGKSTLISRISAARPKIADYPFTTLEPQLGIVQYHDDESFTVADIPGLIEGAHMGKGLGIQFLRHIERTRVLVILIESNSDDYHRDLMVLRRELHMYSKGLDQKPWFPVISKLDIVPDDFSERLAEFEKKTALPVIAFSSVSGENIHCLKESMWSNLIQEWEKEKDVRFSDDEYIP